MDLTITQKYFIIDPPPSGGGGGGSCESEDISNVKFMQELVDKNFLPASMQPILDSILEESEETHELPVGETTIKEETVWDKVKTLAGIKTKAKRIKW